jgi:hypothetical protein
MRDRVPMPSSGPGAMRQIGLEPMTYGLEGRCSIQLSYWRAKSESGRPDSNWRPLAPKASALPG